MARPRKQPIESVEESLNMETNMETTTESPKHGNVFGIKGKQMIQGGKFLTDEDGKVRHFKGDKSELLGTGEGMKEYEYRILHLTIKSRAYTGPASPDKIEGYVSRAKVVEKFGHNVKIFPETAEYQNNCIDWKLPGNPRAILWLFPVGMVKDGDELTDENGQVECKYVPFRDNATEHIIYRLIFHPKTTKDA